MIQVILILVCLLFGTITSDYSIITGNSESADKCTDENDIKDYLTTYTNKQFQRQTSTKINIVTDIFVAEIVELSERESSLTMEIFLDLRWTDDLLRVHYPKNHCFKNVSLSPESMKSLWNPNVCFINSRSVTLHKSPNPNILTMVEPSGTVTIPCIIDFEKFPFDVQTCHMQLESYDSHADKIALMWKEFDPLFFSNEHKLPLFRLTNHSTSRQHMHYAPGKWDELIAKLYFERKLAFYVSRIYIPSFLFTLMSWIPFRMSVQEGHSRIMLQVIALLLPNFQFMSIMYKLPEVSYFTALDLWVFGVSILIVGSLIESALVYYIVRRSNAIQEQKSTPGEETASMSISDGTSSSDIRPLTISSNLDTLEGRSENKILSMIMRKPISIKPLTAKTVDNVAMILFPLVFSVFNILYWNHYL